jgi:hypothetical protein
MAGQPSESMTHASRTLVLSAIPQSAFSARTLRQWTHDHRSEQRRSNGAASPVRASVPAAAATPAAGHRASPGPPATWSARTGSRSLSSGGQSHRTRLAATATGSKPRSSWPTGAGAGRRRTSRRRAIRSTWQRWRGRRRSSGRRSFGLLPIRSLSGPRNLAARARAAEARESAAESCPEWCPELR